MKHFKEIEQHLTEGMSLTVEEHQKCLDWIVSFSTANNMSFNQLKAFCITKKDWILREIFD